MSLSDKRRAAQGKKLKHHRMPKPDQCKMGTRVHEQDQYEPEIPELEKCPLCESFVEADELDDLDGACWDCYKEKENES